MQVIADILLHFGRVGEENCAVEGEEEVGLEERVERDVATA
jgi:hypothetical protein